MARHSVCGHSIYVYTKVRTGFFLMDDCAMYSMESSNITGALLIDFSSGLCLGGLSSDVSVHCITHTDKLGPNSTR